MGVAVPIIGNGCKCFVKIPLEWKQGNPNLTNLQRRLENIVLDFGQVDKTWRGRADLNPDKAELWGKPFSIENIWFGTYDSVYDPYYDEIQFAIRDNFFDVSQFATPITNTNATLEYDLDYVLFGDKSIRFSGSGEQIRVSYNPLWKNYLNERKEELSMHVYFPNEVSGFQIYDISDDIVRVSYTTTVGGATEYPLFAWDNDGAGRGSLGTKLIDWMLILSPGWHEIRISRDSGMFINYLNQNNYNGYSFSYNGSLKFNTFGYDSFTNTAAEAGVCVQNVLFYHHELAWRDTYRNRLYLNHDPDNKKYYDKLYDDVAFIIRADDELNDTTGNYSVIHEGAISTQTTNKKFGDSASDGNGWVRVPYQSGYETNIGFKDGTVDGWFYFPTLNGLTDVGLFGAADINDDEGWSIEIIGNDIVLRVDGSDRIVVPHGMIAGTWYHIMMSVKGKNRWYIGIDGNVLGTVDYVATRDWNNKDIAIGARNALGIKPFDGYFDDVRMTTWCRWWYDYPVPTVKAQTLMYPEYRNLMFYKGKWKNIDGSDVFIQYANGGDSVLSNTSVYNFPNVTFDEFNCDGTSYLNISQSGGFEHYVFNTLSRKFTFSFDIKRPVGTYGTIASNRYYTGDGGNMNWIEIVMPDANTIHLKFKDWQATPDIYTLTGTIPPADGHYHNCKFTYDGTTLRYYLDDVLNNSLVMSASVRTPYLSFLGSDINFFARYSWDTYSYTEHLGQGAGPGEYVNIQNIKLYSHATLD